MPSWWHSLGWVLPLRHDALTPVFAFFTTFGSFTVYIVIILLLAWLWQPAFINRLLPWVGVSAVSNSWLKAFFQDPRPDKQLVIPGYAADGFGMPSGHTQLAVFFWGAVAWQLYRTKSPAWLWIAAIVTAVMISFSRPYLGVHDVQDVMIGALIGSILLLIFWFLPRQQLAPKPAIVIAAFSCFALLAYAAWPGSDKLHAVAPALAMVAAWYGGQLILTCVPVRLSGNLPQQIILATTGIFVLLLVNFVVRQFLFGWQAQSLLLLCVGLLGVGWPALTARSSRQT
jgi:membrane-associated phospholipid phosphatase